MASSLNGTGVTFSNGSTQSVAGPAAGATCTYTGTLVEAGYVGTTAAGGHGTADLGSNRVMTGVRTAYIGCGVVGLYARGYNIKNN